MPDYPPASLRLALVLIGLAIWHLTQRLIKLRSVGDGTIGDAVHDWTAGVHRYLSQKPYRANTLLVLSSIGIDGLGVFVLGWSIFGPSVQPFLGLLVCFVLRQICQATCSLPPPAGMIWRYPGVPSLLVTYGVSNDLFFSGHTAMAVYGAIELVRWGGSAWIAVGVAIAVFETMAVLVLRAHYTMDVFAGAVTGILAVYAADAMAPACDAWLVELGRRLFGT